MACFCLRIGVWLQVTLALHGVAVSLVLCSWGVFATMGHGYLGLAKGAQVGCSRLTVFLSATAPAPSTPCSRETPFCQIQSPQ